MNPKISIVLPIYNTGDILTETIESILGQSFSDFELLVIDDGSLDGTMEIAKKYALVDNRIRLFTKENGGVCSARNIGIKYAIGEYITFCDHDDVYDSDILKKEVELTTFTENCDLAIVGAKHIYDDGIIKSFGENIICKTRSSLLENSISIIKNKTIGTIWNILYRRKLIKSIRFDEKSKKGHEDIIFNIEVLSRASSLVSIKKPYYFHFIRKNMSTSARFHTESIGALTKANNCISVFVKDIVRDYDSCEYINLQGEYIRTLATYSIRLNNNYRSFKRNIELLSYIKQGVNLLVTLRMFNKDVFSFYCLEKRYFRLFYIVLKVYKSTKGG